MRIARIVIALAIAASLFLVVTSPALATAPPDGTPTISNVHVNRNLLTASDTLFYGDYYIPYTSPPNETAQDTYIFTVRDSTGEIGATTPFVFFNLGYNWGVFSLYFSDNVIDWTNNTYTVRISQSPANFASPQTWDYPVSVPSYTLKPLREDNQLEVEINILAAAQRLATHYPTYTLTEPSAGGTVLSSPSGTQYFRGSVYGIQAMAPSLFLVQVVDTTEAPRAWTTTQFDAYENRFNGTWIANDTARTSAQFGLSPTTLMAVIFTVPVCFGFILLSQIKFKRIEPGYVASFLIIIGMSLLGWFPRAVLACLLQLCAIYSSFILLWPKS